MSKISVFYKIVIKPFIKKNPELVAMALAEMGISSIPEFIAKLFRVFKLKLTVEQSMRLRKALNDISDVVNEIKDK